MEEPNESARPTDSSPLIGTQSPQSSVAIIAVPQAPPLVVYVDLRVQGCNYSGVAQIFIGMLSLVFGVVSIGIECNMSYVAYPLWAGILFVATGYVGCRVVRKITEGSHTAMMAYATLTAFSVIVALNMLIVMSDAAANEPNSVEDPDAVSSQAVRIAIDCVIVFLSSAEMGAASWGCFVALRGYTTLSKHKKRLRAQANTTTYRTMSNTVPPVPPYASRRVSTDWWRGPAQLRNPWIQRHTTYL